MNLTKYSFVFVFILFFCLSQEKESFLPLNPMWFSSTALRAMEEVSPSQLSDVPSPPARKVNCLTSLLSCIIKFLLVPYSYCCYVLFDGAGGLTSGSQAS